MKIRCRYDEELPLTQLKPHPKNPNKHPEAQIKRLAQVIEYQGIRHPIVISRASGYITKGHGRLLAAKELKLETFPVEYQEYESEEQEYADIVADNSIALWAELDLAAINQVVPDLGPDFELTLLGLKDFVLDPSEINFPPGDENGQGKLDEKTPVICPKCGEKFITS